MDLEAAQKVRRPSAGVRTAQILDAAEECFRVYGFHAASMAQIAATADISVGHIYRYFPAKEAIVAAIAERDLDATLAQFDAIEAEAGPVLPGLYDHLRAAVARLGDRRNAALRLEVLAEAARNPQIERVLRAKRARVFERMVRIVRRAAGPDLAEAEAAERVRAVFTLIDAAPVQRLTEPEDAAGDAPERLASYAACILENGCGKGSA